MSYPVSFCSCVFSPLSIAITSLEEERELILVLFLRLFDWCLFAWICRFPLPLGVLGGLRFVIVALPGLFLLHFFHMWRLFCQCLLLLLVPREGYMLREFICIFWVHVSSHIIFYVTSVVFLLSGGRKLSPYIHVILLILVRPNGLHFQSLITFSF